MKFKLDENLSRHLKMPLEELGHDIHTAAEEGLLSQPDHVIAAAAKAEGRILLTLDLDFADIRRFPPGSHPGIFLFRPATLGLLEVNRCVVEFIRQQDLSVLTGCLVVVESNRIRIRRSE